MTWQSGESYNIKHLQKETNEKQTDLSRIPERLRACRSKSVKGRGESGAVALPDPSPPSMASTWCQTSTRTRESRKQWKHVSPECREGHYF